MTTKERRALARRNGKCGSCTIRDPEPGRKSCGTCLASKNRTGDNSSHRRREVVPVNICCQSHGEHRFDCGAVERRGPGPFLRRVA